jgi:hypothetical protein
MTNQKQMARNVSGKREGNRFVEALNSAAEASATLIPLVALILGIGMMRLLPANVKTPLFGSESEASRFYSQIGVGDPGNSPIMLVASPCDSCTQLQTALYNEGIGFEEVDVSTPHGAALFELASSTSSSKELPKLVIGMYLVRPDTDAVKRVLGTKR